MTGGLNPLSLLSSILLGLIQGLAEFLPISSSGHLAIAEHFLGQAGVPATPDFFDVLLHLGTLLIIVGTLPLFVVLPVKDLVEGLSGNIYFVAGALIVTGFLLFASDRVKKGRKTERSAKLLDVLLVGIAQAIATCPGISRSGTTITAGCFVGFDRKFAVRFSFLLSIPAVLGANILTLKDAIQENSIIVSDIPVYLVGVAVAAVVGYICIRLLKMIADKGKFGWFAYYCWAVGLIVLALTLVLK